MKDCSNSKENCQQRLGTIYKITNLLNGKIYVGQTVQKLSARINQHKNSDRKGIDQAIKKYGIENFKIEVIEECPYEQLNEHEIFWIAHYDCLVPDGYNLHAGGKNHNYTQAEFAKLSESSKGENNPFYGRKHTTETKMKISETNKAKGIKPPSRKGCKNTEEHKAKISASGKGRKCSEETRAKISAANKGRKPSAEARAKMSAAKKGKKRSEKHNAEVAISLFEDDNN